MKKWGGQLDIRPPNLKIGGGRVPPIPPRIDTPARSGSGKLVYDQYDNLRNIWGGSPNTMPLPTGIDSSSVNDGELLPQGHDDSSDNDESGDLGKRFVINCFRYSVLIIRPHAGLVKTFE